MRHKNDGKILEIPVTVSLQPTPCTWVIGEGGQFRAHQVKTSGHSVRHPATLDSRAVTFPDAWDVRSTFLELRDEHDFLGFLNQTGCFFSSGTYEDNQSWRLTDFAVWQRALTGFLRRQPEVWEKRLDLVEPNGTEIMRAVRLHRCFTVQFGQGRSAPFIARNTFSAILATIYLDHLRGARFRLCARPDCRKPYEIESNHERRYCTQYCASLESLRRKRSQANNRNDFGPNDSASA